MEESITQLLDAWRDGDRSVENELINRVYPMLHTIAQAQLRRPNDPITLGTTDLLHEAYERLVQQKQVEWRNRKHFYAIAAMVMRRLVVDYLRQRIAEKRGGGAQRLAIEDVAEELVSDARAHIDWLALDQALSTLAVDEPDCARVVELRVFTGLSIADVAEVMGTSLTTVKRQWRFARSWLAAELGYDVSEDEQG